MISQPLLWIKRKRNNTEKKNTFLKNSQHLFINKPNDLFFYLFLFFFFIKFPTGLLDLFLWCTSERRGKKHIDFNTLTPQLNAHVQQICVLAHAHTQIPTCIYLSIIKWHWVCISTQNICLFAFLLRSLACFLSLSVSLSRPTF